MIVDRLAALGLELPEPSKPGANYVPYHWDGGTLLVTGQLAQWNGERRFIGKLGARFDLSEGQAAAQLSALNVLSLVNQALNGDGARVEKVLRLGVYVNSSPDFHGQSQVANGASDLFVHVFGDAGRHTRMAIGVTALPYDVATEVEASFSIKP